MRKIEVWAKRPRDRLQRRVFCALVADEAIKEGVTATGKIVPYVSVTQQAINMALDLEFKQGAQVEVVR